MSQFSKLSKPSGHHLEKEKSNSKSHYSYTNVEKEDLL